MAKSDLPRNYIAGPRKVTLPGERTKGFKRSPTLKQYSDKKILEFKKKPYRLPEGRPLPAQKKAGKVADKKASPTIWQQLKRMLER